MYNWEPIGLSLQLSLFTTAILLVLGIPLAWLLAYHRFKSKAVVETLITLPLVLPPTVLGFYFLIAFHPDAWPGYVFKEWLGIELLFSFPGLVLASVIYSLPFMIQPLQNGFETFPRHLREASYTLGKSRLATLFRVIIPNIKASLVSGIVLSFAHTMGEFGVVLMIGGNIPGETRVASLAIFDQVEALNYETAHFYALVLLVITFSILLLTKSLNRRWV